MTTNNNQPARQITLKGKKAPVRIEYETLAPMIVLMAACMVESTAFYIYPSRSGQAIKVKLYDKTGPVECWINCHEDMSEQIDELILEFWGEQTRGEAHALVALGGLQPVSNGAEIVPPTRKSGRANKRA